MKKIFDIVTQNSLLFLIISIIFALPFISFTPFVKTVDNVDYFTLENDPDVEFYDKFKELFGNDEFFIIAFEKDDIFTTENLTLLQNITDELEDIDDIREVKSLANVDDTIILNFGIMGIAGIPLNTATALIAAVALGIAVDDTIHFLTEYKEKRTEGASIIQSVKTVIFLKGRAILSSSLILCIGFGVLVLSRFVPTINPNVAKVEDAAVLSHSCRVVYATLG